MAAQIVQAAKTLDGLILALPDVTRGEEEQLAAIAALQEQVSSPLRAVEYHLTAC